MKFTRILMLTCCAALSFSVYAGDDCSLPDDNDSNPTIYSYNYQVEPGKNKLIRKTIEDGRRKISLTHCVNEFSSGGVSKKYAVLGMNYDGFEQCVDRSCFVKKAIFESTIEIFPNYLASKCHFTVPVQSGFGYDCKDVGYEPYVSTADSCVASDYCITNNLKKRTKKIVRIVIESGNYPSMTMCLSRFDRVGIQYLRGLKPDHEYSIKYYQCHNFDCNDYKEVASDTVALDSNANLDHEKYYLELDPAYGENCSTAI